MILVVCALPAELRSFTNPPGVEIFACGVGPVEAALRTARKLATASYDLVVSAGIGGAFPGRSRVGDAVLVTSETYADFGLEGGGELAVPPGTLVDIAHADAGLLVRLGEDPALPCGTGITVSAVTATAATGERLAARYGAAVESMEGFAVLRAATLAGTPALEVRGISNYVGERARSAWDFEAGEIATAAALTRMLDRLRG